VKPSRDWTRWGGIAFLGVCAVLAIAFYREFIFDSTRMLYGDDMLNEGYQLRSFGVEEIRSGRGFPLWNPFVYGGQPYLAILPGPVFYPTSLLYLVMPLFRAIGWTFVLHTALSGTFAWWAARSLGVGRWAAAVAGVSYLLTGFVVSTLYGGHDGRMFAMVLIPLAFGLLERGLSSGRTGWFLGFGLVVALQVFTPHIQLMYFSSLALSAYGAARIVEQWRGENGRSRGLRLVALWTLGFGVAALVGAAQLIPTYRILDVAVRGSAGEGGYAFASSWALPPQELTALFLPDLIGSLDTYWGSNPFKLHTEYLGAVPLVLAAIGITAGRRDRRASYLAGLAALCLLFALGSVTPVHRLAYAVVPFIKQFRAPSMMIGPAALAVALLAGLGWQRVLDARSERVDLPWTWLWVAAAPLLLLGLAAALSPDGLLRWVRTSWYPAGWTRLPPAEAASALRANGWFLLAGVAGSLAVARAVVRGRLGPAAVLILLAILVADLWRVDGRYLRTMRPEEYFRTDAVIERLQMSLEPGERVFPLPDGVTYRPNELMYYRVPAVTGLQKFRLDWYERLVGGLSNANLLSSPALWDLLNLRYLTTVQTIDSELVTVEATGDRGSAYRLVRDRPHAWFPARVEATTDTAAALRSILTTTETTDLAVVEAERAPPAGRGSASLVDHRANELTLRVEAEEEGLLFVSEIYYPAWRAYVDAEEVEILRVNTAFRGVVVPQGTHEVRFDYSAVEFRAGFLISGTTLAAVLLGLVGLAVAGRRSRTVAEI
jgi:hypothetical protein